MTRLREQLWPVRTAKASPQASSFCRLDFGSVIIEAALPETSTLCASTPWSWVLWPALRAGAASELGWCRRKLADLLGEDCLGQRTACDPSCECIGVAEAFCRLELGSAIIEAALPETSTLCASTPWSWVLWPALRAGAASELGWCRRKLADLLGEDCLGQRTACDPSCECIGVAEAFCRLELGSAIIEAALPETS
eukprot:CAMPEP_0170609606 /NCGR_PEP_ID=MMETSP0224-20130122/22214_1 /TAXON_ID=285029 /ORGANISM="Togula jolla, Strain CCCM 725" /LENGTH=195 /DNA_ID=CAMNT_0010934923 /DNA_START=254 /DNA_END=839 /DNA_ORIENTATION=-